jgi:hypothetical protein
MLLGWLARGWMHLGVLSDGSRRLLSGDSIVVQTPASLDSGPKARPGASSAPHIPRLLSTSSTRFLLDQLLYDFSRRGSVWGMGNPCVCVQCLLYWFSHTSMRCYGSWQSIVLASICSQLLTGAKETIFTTTSSTSPSQSTWRVH